jgi:hypothetical protein
MENFTAIESRRELLLSLSGAMTDAEELTGLWAFLRDDFPYDPAYRAVVGPVLREREFDPWRDLMLEVQQPTATSRNFDAEKVRELAGKLLAEMKAR